MFSRDGTSRAWRGGPTALRGATGHQVAIDCDSRHRRGLLFQRRTRAGFDGSVSDGLPGATTRHLWSRRQRRRSDLFSWFSHPAVRSRNQGATIAGLRIIFPGIPPYAIKSADMGVLARVYWRVFGRIFPCYENSRVMRGTAFTGGFGDSMCGVPGEPCARPGGFVPQRKYPSDLGILRPARPIRRVGQCGSIRPVLAANCHSVGLEALYDRSLGVDRCRVVLGE